MKAIIGVKRKFQNNCIVQIVVSFWLKLNPEARPELTKAHSIKKWIDLGSIVLRGIARLLLLLKLLRVIDLNQSTLKMLELIDPFLDLLGWSLRFI